MIYKVLIYIVLVLAIGYNYVRVLETIGPALSNPNMDNTIALLVPLLFGIYFIYDLVSEIMEARRYN